MRRVKAIVLLPSLLSLVLFQACSFWPQKQAPPNILLIMTDDQGWFDAGFNGNTRLLTPHLDHLAGEGIILDRFYAASAVCSPTRASVLTGRNPMRMGIPDANSGHMPLEEITLPELLKEQGYATGHFGKWHLGILTTKTKDANRGGKSKHEKHFSIPSMHGYDEFFCTESKVPTYDPLIKPHHFMEGESLRYGWRARENGEASESYQTAYWVGHEEMASGKLEGENTRLIMDRVLPFIRKSVDQSRPFFATIWPHTPHLPVVADEKFRRLYADLSLEEQLYYGSITAMDAQIGRLWSELETLEVAENTMIWFCSDNGPENHTPGSAGAFRDRKRSLHEGGLRTPAFLVWKAKYQGGRRVDFPAFTSDYLPTLVELLGLTFQPSYPLDGISLVPHMDDPDKIRRKAMGFCYKNQLSWVNHRYKLISRNDGKSFELYDLLQDKSESKDLYQELPELAESMKKELEAWLSSVEHSKLGKDY